MVEFIMIVNSELKSEFVDKADRKKLNNFLSAVYQKTLNKKIKVTFEIYQEGKITEKQYGLYSAIIRLISNESGNEFLTVEQEFMRLYKNSLFEVKDMDHNQFQDFLAFIQQKSIDIFGYTFTINDESKIYLH
jgi:hypothetical protein